jgi:hypothetical protein
MGIRHGSKNIYEPGKTYFPRYPIMNKSKTLNDEKLIFTGSKYGRENLFANIFRLKALSRKLTL